MTSFPAKSLIATILQRPSSKALFSQVFGGVFAIVWWKLGFINITATYTNMIGSSSETELGAGICVLLLLWGGAASLCGAWVLMLPRWWILINLLFPIAVYSALILNVPGWVYLLAFVLSLTVFWNVRSDRVPLYLSNQKTCLALHDIQKRYATPQFLDIGCGIGSTISTLAIHNPQGRFVGIENAPFPYLIAKIRSYLTLFTPLRNNKVIYGDMWQHDLYDYDVVYCFLSPEPMPRMFEKAKREMKEGSILISNSFEIPGTTPKEVIQVDDSRKTRLMIWEI